MASKLFNQLEAAEVSDEDLEALYSDLKFIMENPFDPMITAAMGRGCSYVEINQPVAH